MTTDAVQAFADPSRRAILDCLLPCERAVSEIVAAVGLSQPAVSQHLRVLLDARLVTVRRDGRRGFGFLDGCRLNSDHHR